MWPAAYASRERASITTMSESPALRSTDKFHESVWKRSLSSIIVAASPGSGAPYSRTAEISRAMLDSVLECLFDLGSSEPEAQPVSPEIQLTMKSTIHADGLCRRPQRRTPTGPPEGLRGVIHADGYSGFNELFAGRNIVEAGWWTHVLDRAIPCIRFTWPRTRPRTPGLRRRKKQGRRQHEARKRAQLRRRQAKRWAKESAGRTRQRLRNLELFPVATA